MSVIKNYSILRNSWKNSEPLTAINCDLHEDHIIVGMAIFNGSFKNTITLTTKRNGKTFCIKLPDDVSQNRIKLIKVNERFDLYNG